MVAGSHLYPPVHCIHFIRKLLGGWDLPEGSQMGGGLWVPTSGTPLGEGSDWLSIGTTQDVHKLGRGPGICIFQEQLQ